MRPEDLKVSRAARAPFWSDDFDMDLLRLFPDLEESLGEMANVPIWTVGHTTHGRLNHPVTWNTGFVAFWLQEPQLERDENGWFNIDGHVDNAPLIEATWLEVLRDAWPHGYRIQIYGTPWLLWDTNSRRGSFQRIMWSIRGWGSNAGTPAGPDVSPDLASVRLDIDAATRMLALTLEDRGLLSRAQVSQVFDTYSTTGEEA